MRKILTLLIVVIGAAGSLTGCGTARDVTIAKTRIVSLSPTATETLFAIGAGSSVIAVDDKSDFPAYAPRQKGLSGFQPDSAKILAFKPDLVIIANDFTDTTGVKLTEALQKKVKVRLAEAPSTLEGVYQQITELGDATGYPGGAEDLIAKMRTQIDDIVSEVKRRPQPPRYYHEIDGQFYTATSQTFVGSIYSLFGLLNIADPFDTRGNGYPQLKPADIVQADPDLIYLADSTCCNQSAGSVTARPGWNTIKAVHNRQVYVLDDAVASRWGPRVVDLTRAIAATLK
ncbi:ABC transporter substrate-binding protein [Actinoplanes sp. NPDC049265]|uniref:ABC transporter substrate-binding protein n=1 Tax=Actinoplanes sp. NPDC049265 TaxID=3363902 RepID=UPI003721747B